MRYMILYFITSIKQNINHNRSTIKFITQTISNKIKIKNQKSLRETTLLKNKKKKIQKLCFNKRLKNKQ